MPDRSTPQGPTPLHPQAGVKFADRWVSIADIAAYLGYCVSHVKHSIIVQPSFPRRIRPSGHPRWLMSEVETWAKRQQARHRSIY